MEEFNINNTLGSLEVALRGLNLRNQSIAANLANINTPGYKRQVVNFEQTLQKVQDSHARSDIPLTLTHPAHCSNNIFDIDVSGVQPEVSIDAVSELNANQNNVDVDAEMTYLAQTGLKFKAVAELSKRRFDGLRGVIRG